MSQGVNKQRALLDQPLGRVVWQLAVPSMGAVLLRYANHAVDQFWVGRLPDAAVALAGVSASNFLIWVIYSLAALFATGLGAQVARAVGAGDDEAHHHAVVHGLSLSFVLSVLFAGFGLLTQDMVFRFQGLPGPVQATSHAYLTVILLGLPASYVGFAYGTIYRAEGDTVTPFKLAVLALVLNAVLDPPFILGWGPIPAMGVAGSALATVLVQIVQLVVLVVLHRRHRTTALPAGLNGGQYLRLIRIGYPVALSGVVFSAIYIVLVKVLAPFGAGAVAALGLGHTIEGFPHFIGVGFGTAAATLVGQNLGAGRKDEAVAAVWHVARYLCAVLIPVALLYGTLAPWLLSAFMADNDPQVLAYGTQYLRIAAAVQVFGSVGMLLAQAMNGAGYTAAPTAVDLGASVLRIALAVLLAHTLAMGPFGVWLAIGASNVIGFGGLLILFRRGTWQHKELG